MAAEKQEREEEVLKGGGKVKSLDQVSKHTAIS